MFILVFSVENERKKGKGVRRLGVEWGQAKEPGSGNDPLEQLSPLPRGPGEAS